MLTSFKFYANFFGVVSNAQRRYVVHQISYKKSDMYVPVALKHSVGQQLASATCQGICRRLQFCRRLPLAKLNICRRLNIADGLVSETIGLAGHLPTAHIC